MAGGVHEGRRLMARPTVQLMMSDQLTDAQRQGSELFFGHGATWGMGGAVVTRAHRHLRRARPVRLGRRLRHLGLSRSGEDMIGVLMTPAHDGGTLTPPRCSATSGPRPYQDFRRLSFSRGDER
jgi:hypothetical protein